MSTALAAPPTHAVADLLLVRMALPNSTPKKVREDVGGLLDGGLSVADFEELRRELAGAGLLTAGKRNTFALTDAGRERALRFLGVSELPPRLRWPTLVTRYLFPRAAGISASTAEKLDRADTLAALVLKRKYGLAAGAGSTVKQALEALVCKELGFPQEVTLDGLLCTVLSRLLGSERLPKETLLKQLPLFGTGLTRLRADDIRRKLIRDWLAGAVGPDRPGEPRPAEPFGLATFAGTVRALAMRSAPEDRFHDNKVFIAALWRASQREPNFPRLALPAFKQRLLDANAQHLLHLSRADLVQVMDPRLVAESETVQDNATYHFVLLEGDRP